MAEHTRPVLAQLRYKYHTKILTDVLGYRTSGSRAVVNNADTTSQSSKSIALRLAKRLSAYTGKPLQVQRASGQTVGGRFASYTAQFLEEAFRALGHLHTADWTFGTTRKITEYSQYEHLERVEEYLKREPLLRTEFGSDYIIGPDIVVGRLPLEDTRINRYAVIVTGEDPVARLTPFRQNNNVVPILHASVSCKWTMRSDRAQNTRTEALNLIRNRKGKLPHVVAVIAEPLPTRIASLALGTGDLDCVYHMALNELTESVEESQNEDQLDMITTLVEGRRLRDIADLPFDLSL